MRDFKEGKTVEIRVGELADYSACLPLFSLLYHGDIGADFKHTFEEFVENEDGVVLLAERSGKVVGVLVGSYHLDIDWEGQIGKIDAVIIEDAHRKRGLGRALVRHFVATARKKRCKAIKSRVNRENAIAQRFHEA